MGLLSLLLVLLTMTLSGCDEEKDDAEATDKNDEEGNTTHPDGRGGYHDHHDGGGDHHDYYHDRGSLIEHCAQAVGVCLRSCELRHSASLAPRVSLLLYSIY